MLEVLEHINEYEKVLENISSMNFKQLIISVPNEPIFSLSNMVFGKNVMRMGKDPEHVNYWNKKTLKNLLSDYFNVTSVKLPYPWIVATCVKK